MTTREIVVDDHVLLRMLLDDEPIDLRANGAKISTTGLWYHRLCRALVASTVTGVYSRSLGSADPLLGERALRAVLELPDTIGLVSLRDVAWPMAALLGSGVRLNLMSLEALAAAQHLGAEICLAAIDANPPLIAAAVATGTSIRLIA